MAWTAALPLLGVWTLAVVSPGPDFVVVLRHSAAHSRGAGLRIAVGVVSGIGVWALAGMVGVATVLERFAWLYTTIRVAGALFLIWLGISALRAARRHAPTADADPAPAPCAS